MCKNALSVSESMTESAEDQHCSDFYCNDFRANALHHVARGSFLTGVAAVFMMYTLSWYFSSTTSTTFQLGWGGSSHRQGGSSGTPGWITSISPVVCLEPLLQKTPSPRDFPQALRSCWGLSPPCHLLVFYQAAKEIVRPRADIKLLRTH